MILDKIFGMFNRKRGIMPKNFILRGLGTCELVTAYKDIENKWWGIPFGARFWERRWKLIFQNMDLITEKLNLVSEGADLGDVYIVNKGRDGKASYSNMDQAVKMELDYLRNKTETYEDYFDLMKMKLSEFGNQDLMDERLIRTMEHIEKLRSTIFFNTDFNKKKSGKDSTYIDLLPQK